MPTHRATRENWDLVLAKINRNGERVVTVVSEAPNSYTVLTEDLPPAKETRSVADGYVKGDRSIPEPSGPNPGVGTYPGGRS